MGFSSISQMTSIAARQVAQASKAANTTPVDSTTSGDAANGFSKVLAEGIDKANATVKAGDAAVEQMVQSGGANLHETMIALDKAEITTRLTVKVGQKLVNAYREISQINV